MNDKGRLKFEKSKNGIYGAKQTKNTVTQTLL